jgi:hypothetical protein
MWCRPVKANGFGETSEAGRALRGSQEEAAHWQCSGHES